MPQATFLSNETLWDRITALAQSPGPVSAAVAYFAQGGAKLLPLKRGDRLVVDMSEPIVKSGATDPREIEKLIKRGVHVFSRRGLHAKLMVAGNCVIAGSANVSRRSQTQLDESGILTMDRIAVKRAQGFIDRLSTEPVGPEYLKRCKAIYQPPKFEGAALLGRAGGSRVRHAKLWIVNLRDFSVPPAEEKRFERSVTKARRLLKNTKHSRVDSFHWSSKPRMASELETGDWVIQVVAHANGWTQTYPPGQFLEMERYSRGNGKLRYVFHLEYPKQDAGIPWSKFRREAAALFPNPKMRPRTVPVRDHELADRLLRLWTDRGRIKKRR